MKKVFESVIKRGGYDLATLLKRIDGYHAEGKLSDAERDELYALARTSPEAQYDLRAEIERLWAAVRRLEANGKTDTDTENTVKEFVQPTGAHDAYMTGDTVLYNGKVYISLIDGNVWSPNVYPQGWSEVGT